MRKLGFIAAGLVAAVTSVAANAAVITYTVSATPNAGGATGTWQAFAQLTSGDNLGLASLQFNVVGTGGVSVTSSTNRLPRGIDDNFTGTGFSLLPSNGTAGIGISASQNTVQPYTIDAEGDPSIYQGVGLSGGSALVNGGASSVSWLFPVLIATGNYSNSGAGGTLTVTSPSTTNVQVLNTPAPSANSNSFFTTSAVASITPGATTISPTTAVPEPASLGILALGGLALLARRRKA